MKNKQYLLQCDLTVGGEKKHEVGYLYADVDKWVADNGVYDIVEILCCNTKATINGTLYKTDKIEFYNAENGDKFADLSKDEIYNMYIYELEIVEEEHSNYYVISNCVKICFSPIKLDTNFYVTYPFFNAKKSYAQEVVEEMFGVKVE